MKSHISRMLDWMSWADRRTIAAVAVCPAAQAEAVPLVVHLLAAEHVWLARLEGCAPRLPVWPTLSLAECDALAAENAAGYRRYIERVDEAALAEVIQYRNQSGHEFSTAVIDILIQIITHGSYHRGQIARIIGRAGSPAPETDYIHFVRAQSSSGS